MRKSFYIIYIILILSFSCIPNGERPNKDDGSLIDINRTRIETLYIEMPSEPIIIYKTDTVYVEVQIAPNLQDRYADALKKYLGTREEWGSNDGEVVRDIIKRCGFNYPISWCSCYLNAGLLDIGLKGPKDPAWSPVWFYNKKRIIYERGKDPITTFLPKGTVCGLYFPKLGRVAHTFVVIEDLMDGNLITIEGNTNEQGGREGHGVFIRIRHKREVYKAADWLSDID